MIGGIGGVSLVGIVLVLAIGYFSGPEQAIQLRQDIQENTQIIQQQGQENNSAYSGEDDYEIFTSKVIGSLNTLWQ